MIPVMAPNAARGVAIGLALAAAALVVLLVVLPLCDTYAERSREIDALGQQVADARDALRRAEASRGISAALVKDDAVRALLMEPSSEGTATARLQERLAKAVDGSGARLIALQPLNSEALGPLRRIGLRLQFSADPESLRAVLHGLEYGRPLAVLENVFVHANTARAVGSDRPLTVRLDVYTFLPMGS